MNNEYIIDITIEEDNKDIKISLEENNEYIINITIEEDNNDIEISLEENNYLINVEVAEGAGSSLLPYYPGPTIVEPRKVSQVLETKDKSMSDNITVNKINRQDVSNLAGGETVIIGFE